MAKFDDIIIVTDLDGTFFDDSSKPTPNNVEAVKYFTSNGGHFSFSTGRNESILKKIIPDTISLNNMPAILSNGAYLYDFSTDARFDEVTLPSGAARELAEKIEKEFPLVGIRWNVEEGFVTYNLESISRYDLPVYRNALPEYTKEKLFSMKLYKAVFSAEAEKISAIKEYAAATTANNFSMVVTAPTLFEVMNSDATKGKALGKLKARLGIPNARVYAVGDYDNDYDMLKAADVAVCPQNALDNIKDISDIIVCSNNDGALADLISRL